MNYELISFNAENISAVILKVKKTKNQTAK
jgi:hypothetical protein